ncbi:citramalate synthase, partial [candidate division MSBL1 archaeon SCGC-AAA382C18]
MTKSGYMSAFSKRYGEDLDLPEEVMIFDTTLRDGEQTPGVSFTPEQKLRIAGQLEELRVDVIEAGFPVVSEGEKKSAERITEAGLEPEICLLSRCSDEDIESAIDCNPDSIHVFIATSNIHLNEKLDISKEEALKRAKKSVEKVKNRGIKTEFSAEDATRTNIDYLRKIYKAVEEAGADRTNIPDTVGVAIPAAMNNLTKEIKKEVDIPISVHCHDDFGLANSN